HTEAERNEVAVVHGRILAIKEVGVRQAGGVGVLILGIEAQADRLAAFFEVSTRTGRVPFHVVRPGYARTKVDTGENIRVLPDGTSAVTPGVGSGEAVFIACFGEHTGRTAPTGCTVVDGPAHVTRGAVDRITAVTNIIFALQAAHVGPAHLRSEEHTSELQSRENLVCRLLLE